jgi:hypothetical protein
MKEGQPDRLAFRMGVITQGGVIGRGIAPMVTLSLILSIEYTEKVIFTNTQKYR